MGACLAKEETITPQGLALREPLPIVEEDSGSVKSDLCSHSSDSEGDA